MDLFPVFIVSGPSGAGKTSLWKEVAPGLPWIRTAISHTTRPPRDGESNGVDYFFIDRQEFEEMIRGEQFLEWAEVHGHLYGSSEKNLDRCDRENALLFEVDCRGAKKIRSKLKNVVSIFVMTPSFEDLVNRIKNRGRISEKELSVRLETARKEVKQAIDFDYLIINNTFSKALTELRSIFIDEGCRKEYLTSELIKRWEQEIQLFHNE